MPAEVYSNAAPVNNPFPTLNYSAPRWSFAQRRPRLRKLHGEPTHGRGVRRRDSAELRTDNALGWLHALTTGADRYQDSRGRTLQTAPELYTRMGRITPGLWDLREKIKRAVDWAVCNGPASGWALRNEALRKGETKPLTTYYVPMRSRAAAEKWLRFVRATARLVALFAALAQKVRPVLRTATTEPPPPEKQDVVPTRSEKANTGSRSHLAPDRGGPPRSLGDLLSDLRRKYGEGGDDAT